ncbi:MAG: ShlB/FhaC/HecB family hemolysin secretion/activation protein [Caldimonas sp.]
MIDRREPSLAVAAAALIAFAAWAPASVQAQSPVLEPPAILAAPSDPPPPLVMDVKQYVVQGVTLLPAASIERALAGLTGTRTAEELHRAAAIVQSMYTQAGYGAVVVYLPPQDVSAGVVTLRAIEGRLSAVRVEGATPDVPADAVLASLPALKRGETPRLDIIDQQLRMANDNPARRMRLVLLPGQQPEQTEAEVAVVPGAVRQASLELDNTGTRSTGRARMALGWRDANLSGRDDVVDLRLQFAPEHPRQFAAVSANYRLPLYEHATLLEAYALASDTRSGRIPTAAGDLQFAGRGYLLGLRGTHYLSRLRDFDPRVALSVERREQRNQCAIGELPDGDCGGATGDLTLTPLTIEYSITGDTPSPLALAVAVVQGLPVGGRHADRAAFDALRPGARPDFTALRMQASALRALGTGGWEAGARFAGQWAAQPLVPAMQFGAGGRESARGYEERELSADHGAALSLELSAPRVRLAAWPGSSWRPLVFADAASLRNRGDAPCSGTRVHCELASAGLGLRLDASALSLALDIAQTLHDGGTTTRHRTWGHLWLRLVH